MNLFIDIETIPSQKPGILEDIRKDIKPPGNISKPETIAKWMAENADSAAEEKWRKTALDGSLGEILCIGWAVDDGPTNSIFRTIGGDEAKLLKIFYREMIEQGITNLSTIIGHHVKDFDLRFIYQRSVINRVRPTFPLRNDSRYGGDFVYDTMLAWAGWGNRISLKNLCAALDIECKQGDIDGSKVWNAAKEDRYAEICEYCESDVGATRKVWKRLTFNEE